MALNELGLGLILTAKDLASGVIEKVRAEFEKLGTGSKEAGAKFKASLAEFTTGGAMLAAGVAGIAGAFKMAEAAAPFETSMATVAYRTKATTQEMAQLRAAAIEASAGLKTVSETDAARAMAVFAEGGNNATQTMEALNPILKFSKANILDVGQAAMFADDMMDLYGVKASEVGEKLDKTQWAMRRFGLTAGDMTMLMGPMALQAKNVGLEFDDMLLLFGAAAEVAGPRGAFMALRGAMNQISDPDFGKKMKKNFAGIEVKGVGGALRPLTELLPDIAAKMDTMTEKQRANALEQVFGGRAAGGLAAILDKLRTGVETESGAIYYGAEAMRALSGEMRNSAGAVDLAIKALSPYDEATKAAAASWSNLKRRIGEAFLPALTSALNAVGKAAAWVGEQWAKIPAPIREFLTTGFLVISGMLVLGGTIKMITGLVGVLGVAFKALGISGMAANQMLKATVIGALITGAILIIQHWDEVKAWFESFWPKLSAWASNTWNSIKEGVFAMGRAIGNFFTDTLPMLLMRAALGLRKAVQEIPLIGDLIRLAEWATGGISTTFGGPSIDPDMLDRQTRALERAASEGKGFGEARTMMNVAAGPEGAENPYGTATGARYGVPSGERYGVSPAAAVMEARRRAGGTAPPPAPGRAGGSVVIRPRVEVHFDRDGVRTLVQEEIRRNDALGYAAVPEEVE